MQLPQLLWVLGSLGNSSVPSPGCTHWWPRASALCPQAQRQRTLASHSIARFAFCCAELDQTQENANLSQFQAASPPLTWCWGQGGHKEGLCFVNPQNPPHGDGGGWGMLGPSRFPHLSLSLHLFLSVSHILCWAQREEKLPGMTAGDSKCLDVWEEQDGGRQGRSRQPSRHWGLLPGASSDPRPVGLRGEHLPLQGPGSHTQPWRATCLSSLGARGF